MKLVAVALAALALAAPTLAGGEPPRAADLETQLVCPTCKSTLDQSDAPVARRMKAYIRARIAAGASAEEIKQELVDQFGPGVLAEPPRRGFDLLAWWLPLGGIALAAVAVGAVAWRWSRSRGPDAEAAPLDPELERRLDDELARFEP